MSLCSLTPVSLRRLLTAARLSSDLWVSSICVSSTCTLRRLAAISPSLERICPWACLISVCAARFCFCSSVRVGVCAFFFFGRASSSPMPAPIIAAASRGAVRRNSRMCLIFKGKCQNDLRKVLISTRRQLLLISMGPRGLSGFHLGSSRVSVASYDLSLTWMSKSRMVFLPL